MLYSTKASLMRDVTRAVAEYMIQSFKLWQTEQFLD